MCTGREEAAAEWAEQLDSPVATENRALSSADRCLERGFALHHLRALTYSNHPGKWILNHRRSIISWKLPWILLSDSLHFPPLSSVISHSRFPIAFHPFNDNGAREDNARGWEDYADHLF